jgi:hypothetical protein
MSWTIIIILLLPLVLVQFVHGSSSNQLVEAEWPSLLIVVLTQWRVASLSTLWSNIEQIEHAKLKIRVLLHIDNHPRSDSVVKYAHLIAKKSSVYMPVEVIVQQRTLGIRSSYLQMQQYFKAETWVMFL